MPFNCQYDIGEGNAIVDLTTIYLPRLLTCLVVPPSPFGMLVYVMKFVPPGRTFLISAFSLRRLSSIDSSTYKYQDRAGEQLSIATHVPDNYILRMVKPKALQTIATINRGNSFCSTHRQSLNISQNLTYTGVLFLVPCMIASFEFG